jgi:hypothetical protein
VLRQVLAWLRCKLKHLRGALIGSSANYASMDDASLTVYAIGILGEHLSDAWMERLAASCGVSLAGALLTPPRQEAHVSCKHRKRPWLVS